MKEIGVLNHNYCLSEDYSRIDNKSDYPIVNEISVLFSNLYETDQKCKVISNILNMTFVHQLLQIIMSANIALII